MDISIIGGGGVKLVGKNLNVYADPPAGFKENAKTAKGIVVTHSTTEGLATLDEAMVLDRPGEYEVGGAMIMGVPARRHIDESGELNTMFSIQLDGINVVVTGNVAGDLTAAQLEGLGKVDVLVIPVGGHGLTLEPEEAAKLVSRLEPAYVVPVHYDDGHSKYEMPQAKVDLFLKEMGVNPEPLPRLKVSPRELPTETQVIVLGAAG